MKIFLVETDPKNELAVVPIVESATREKVTFQFNSYKVFNQNVLLDLKFEAEKKIEKDDVLVFLLDLSELNPRLWKEEVSKIHKRFSQKKITFITTYEKPELTRNFFNSLEVDNILFKPFDTLITSEIIYLLLQIQKKAQPLALKLQNSKSFIGLLKEVELQTLCELGFTTISDSPIPEKSITQYFSAFSESFWAQCLISQKQSGVENTYLNQFQFINLNKDNLQLLRKYIQFNKSKQMAHASWYNDDQISPKIKIILIAKNDLDHAQIKKDLIGHFKNAEVEFLDMALALATKKPLECDIIFNYSTLKISEIVDFLPPTCLKFKISHTPLNEKALKEEMLDYHEVFPDPVDRPFFYKKIKFHCSALKWDGEFNLTNIQTHEKIKAANKAKIESLNETIINFDYPRLLKDGDYREFIFLDEGDGQNIEVPGYCRFSQPATQVKADDPFKFSHQFYFFGVSDHHLKEIRRWLLKNYIKGTES